MDMIYIQDSGQNSQYTTFLNFFLIKIDLIGRFIEKSKKSFFRKKHDFFDRKLALEEPKWVRWENHVSRESALIFPTNP